MTDLVKWKCMSESVMGAWEHTVVGPDPLPGVGGKGRVPIYSDLPLRYVSSGRASDLRGPCVFQLQVGIASKSSRVISVLLIMSFLRLLFATLETYCLLSFLGGYQVFSVPRIRCPFEKCGSQLSLDHLGAPKWHSDACFGSISMK